MEHFNLIKSFTTLVNNITSLPSREGLGLGLGKVRMGLRMLILCLSLAVLGVNEVWGYNAKFNIKASSKNPTGCGTIYASDKSGATSGDNNSITIGGDKNSTVYAYLYASTNEGYNFKGWSKSDNGVDLGKGTGDKHELKASGTTSNSTTGGTKDNGTWYATFSANTYTVAFNGNGASSGSTASQIFTYNVAQNLNVNGFKKEYIVTFNADGGTADANSLTSSAPFSGWATSANGSVVYSNQQSVSNLSSTQEATVNLYAKWGDYPSVTLPNATKSGKVLVGWSDGETTRLAGESYTPSSNITMTAIWMDSYPFTMSCNVNALKVDEAKTPAFTFTYADNPTHHIADASIIAYDQTSNTLTGLKKGTTTIYFTQSATSTIQAGTSDTYTITVTKIDNTLAVDATHTMKVDETWTSVISGKNSDATVTTTTSDETVAYYDVANNKIVAQNANNQSFNSKEVTITISQAATYKYTEVEKTIKVTVNKHVPTFTWSNTALYHNQTYNDFFTTNCSNALTVKSSSDDNVAYLVDGANAQKLNLQTLSKAASTTLTVTQAENYYWAEHTETKTITPSVAPNHVPFTYNEAMFNDGNITITKAGTSNIFMVDNGRYVQLGEDATTISGGDAWKEKYIVIKFDGIPEKVSFEYATSSSASTSPDFKVYESSNGTNFKEIFSDSRNSSSWSSTITKDLSKDTRYLKFFFDGNFGGQYQHIKVTELKTFSIDKSSLDFGSNKKDIACASQTFTFNYANVGHKVVLETSDPHFSVSPTSITNIGGEKYGSQTITVSYSTDEVHSATNAKLTIKDELGNYKEVTLTGNTTKKVQTINWEEPYDIGESAIPIGKKITGAATASSKLDVIYESSDPSVIEIVDDGKAFKAVAEGSATITAKQVGTEDWEEASISKTFKGTNKIIQVISWNQNFTRLLTNYGTQSLTAIVNLENAETGEQAYSKERSDLITYTSQNTSVVSVNGSTLTIVGKGETTLTATVPGDDLYESATVTIPVKVREPSAGCEDVLLGNDFGSDEYEFFHYSLTSDMEKVVTIDRTTSAIPGVLSFQHKGKKWGLNYSGEIVVYESTNNGQSWTKLGEITPTVDKYNTQTYNLSRNATHVKFFRGKSATGYHYIKNVEISPAQFIESNANNDTIDFGNVTVNSMEERSVTLSYANVKDNLTITKSSDDLTLSCGEIIDLDCGATGTNTFTISFIPTALGDFSDAIQFNDKNSKKNYTLNVKAKVVKSVQHITWNPATTDLLTTDSVQFDAKTSASKMGLSVTYSIPEEQQSIAKIDASTGKLTIYTAGEVTVTVSQEGSDLISPAVPVSKTFTITREIPTITTLPTVTTSVRPATLADLTLQGGEASVEGTFTWKSSDKPIQEGDHTYWVVFTPSNTDWYSSTEVEIHVVLSSKTQYIDWNTQPMYIYCGQILELDAVSKANSDNLATGLAINYRVDNTALATVEGNILTTLKPGTLTITAQQQGDLAYVAAEELQKVIYIQPNVFTGTGDWNDDSNWSAGVSPTDDQPTVLIAGSLIIDNEVTAGVLTIESTGTVTIADGGVLTIEGASAARETYGDLTVGNGGQLVLNASAQLDVRNVYITSSVATHSSGQVSGAERLVNHGDVYFDWTPGANATNTQWHAFTVPFPVNVNTGIYDLDGNKLRAEYHYAVMGYHSDIRANGQYGWKKCYNWNGGILQPGDFYIMATDGDHATYRFKMLAGSSIATPNSKDIIAYSGTGDVSDQGWNAVGNPTLMYGKVDYVVQVLDPTSYTYCTYQANECNFTVGTPFAIQAATDGSMTMLTADAEETYAPARLMDINTIVANCKLFFSNATFSDQLLVSASEEASNTYEIGKDLVKMTMTATPAVPQIFAQDYSVKLCAINTPMTNNQAVVNLLLYAPAVGEYTISAQPMEGVTAYLTYNGTVIWNLSLSAYNLDLNKGDNSGYGVLLTYEAPQVVTDCDEVHTGDQNAQKLIINSNLYILRDGLLYDATGKVIK